jgi:uncharacterized protein (DUF2141 family)
MKNYFLVAIFGMLLALPSLASENNIIIKIYGLRSSKGRVIIMIDNNEKTFKSPNENDAYAIIVLNPEDKKVEISIDPVKASKYGITVIHDENNNGKLDTNFLGTPIEGIGFSNPISLSDDIKFKDIAVIKKLKELVVIIGVAY